MTTAALDQSCLKRRATSLRLRTTLLVIAAIVVVLGTATLVIDFRVDNEVAQRADADLLEHAQALADVFTARTGSSRQPFPSYWVPSFLADDGTIYFRIECRGQHVVSSDDVASLAWPAPAQGQSMAFADVVDHHGTQLRAIALRFTPDLNAMHDEPSDHDTANDTSECLLGLATDRTEMLDFQHSMDRIEFGCVVLGFLVVAILTPLLVTQSLRPLAGLAEAMDKIGPETPSMRLQDTHIRELAPLITRFNAVLSRMEDGLLRERQFASGVAHELRTPLAELRTAIEVELRYPSGRDPHVLLADIGEIGAKMERIVTALLLLTRIEAGIEQLALQRVDVTALTDALVLRHRHRLQERTLDLKLEIEPSVAWMADATLLDVLLGNLLGNALAYAPSGSTVTLRCTPVHWSVINAAPELTGDDIARMKLRFWRKGKDAGVHTGLGLALAASAASAQSLRLELTLHEGNLQASVTP
ncbi:histidine kinase dimerization/phospho-acceptor domain-containing protein [Dyella sp.]|uniref:histidine kinase dimerization/phospho-acceptor domain-containing protein n=1 Tax=Dyella sp. TaxID=1869338 RepID=UPI002B4A749E|nr:histidine kinase dimerization/phospho-acceptor domain-containing protein [Dyella sp.]HKT26702.1 histidine kinase dimerization/phospho-acceptor domain-containing protein [Dyella sp.]